MSKTERKSSVKSITSGTGTEKEGSTSKFIKKNIRSKECRILAVSTAQCIVALSECDVEEEIKKLKSKLGTCLFIIIITHTFILFICNIILFLERDHEKKDVSACSMVPWLPKRAEFKIPPLPKSIFPQ